MAKLGRPFRIWTALDDRVRTLGLLLTGLLLMSCSSDSGGGVGSTGPLIRLHLSSVESATVRAELKITAPDVSGQAISKQTSFAAAPFDPLGVSFQVGTRGATSYQVDLLRDATCPIATGMAALNIDSDGVFDVSVPMQTVDLCGNGVTVTVQVANVVGGKGSVTSVPAGISCTGIGPGCSATFAKDTPVTLSTKTDRGAFSGWSGGTCTGVGNCSFTATQDTQVQAVFGDCHGWCKDTLPFQLTANLYGVAGTDVSNVVVVGEGGTVIKWDGATWIKLTVPGGGGLPNFRAAAAKSGGPSVFLAGDQGAVYQLDTGSMTPTKINGTSTANLRAIGLAAASTYFVGDGGITFNLQSGATAVTTKDAKTTNSLYAMATTPPSMKELFYMGGATAAGKGFAQTWDGKMAVVPQMSTGGSMIAGNINALLCGTAFYYAAGDGGAIVRRSSVTGNGNDNAWQTAASGTTQNLRALWASSDNSIDAVGDSGTITHFNGTSWTLSTNNNGTANLRAIWGSGPFNIYAVGDNGTVLHYLP